MASTPEFTDYICEQLEGLGAVRSRKMFGEYMVYLNDRPVLLVCDDIPYIKMLPCLEELLKDRPTAPPYDGARAHYVLDPDDRETLRTAAALAEEVTPLPKKKAPKKAKEKACEAQTGPVPWHIAWPSHMKPELSDVAAWMDSPLWGELTAWVEETYQTAPIVEYSKCGGAPGWNVKYRKGAKPLCVIYPQSGYFICMVTVGAKLLPELEAMLPTYSPDLQAIYARSGALMGSKWLMVDVKERAHLEDVQRLMLLKARPAKKKSE